MISRLLFWVLALLGMIIFVQSDGMVEVFKWKQMDFNNRGEARPLRMPDSSAPLVFPGRFGREKKTQGKLEVKTSRDTPIGFATRSGINQNDNNSAYIPYNNVPMGVTHYRGRLFVTMPRRRVGIPSTLNFIDLKRDGGQSSPKLNAYPNFELNQFSRSAENLVSVYRTTVDACQRLWFIDTGMLEYPDNRQQIKRPSIWVVDLNTDRVLKRFEIPESIVSTGRGMASLTIDIASPKACGEAFAYIPDLVNSRLYVYSLAADRMWSFAHNYFNFDPLAGDLHIGGQTFRWDDGIFSTSLGPIERDGSRPLLFHAMASNNEFAVSNRVLQQEANAARSDHGNDFRILGNRGEHKQSTMHEYDQRTGVVFYAEIQTNGVGCWNSRKPFTPANHGIVAANADTMIYPSDLTIDEDGDIWVMTNSMPIFIYSTLDANTFNFRIWRQKAVEAKRNTICE